MAESTRSKSNMDHIEEVIAKLASNHLQIGRATPANDHPGNHSTTTAIPTTLFSTFFFICEPVPFLITSSASEVGSSTI